MIKIIVVDNCLSIDRSIYLSLKNKKIKFLFIFIGFNYLLKGADKYV